MKEESDNKKSSTMLSKALEAQRRIAHSSKCGREILAEIGLIE